MSKLIGKQHGRDHQGYRQSVYTFQRPDGTRYNSIRHYGKGRGYTTRYEELDFSGLIASLVMTAIVGAPFFICAVIKARFMKNKIRTSGFLPRHFSKEELEELSKVYKETSDKMLSSNHEV